MSAAPIFDLPTACASSASVGHPAHRSNLTDSPSRPAGLLDPAHISASFISPRQRARKTFELLFEGVCEEPKSQTDEDAGEWDYGDFEGKTADVIRKSDPKYAKWDM